MTSPLLGCSTASPSEPTFTITANYETTLPLIQDAHLNFFIADTGSPRTQLRPRVAGLPDDAYAEKALPSWDPQGLYDGASPLILSDRHQVNWDTWPLQPLGGFIGTDLLEQTTITFDSRNASVHLGPFDPAQVDVLAPLHVPVTRKGEGSTCVNPGACYSYGPNRLVFDIDVEGVILHAILDTGSIRLAFSTEVLNKLPARSDRPFMFADLQDGTQLTVSRAHVTLGEAAIQNVIVQSDGSDEKFLKLELDTGVRIDALVGSTLINAFAATVDFKAPSLTLHPYRSVDHIDQAVGHGIGIMMSHEAHCFRVIGVDQRLPGAKAGILLGDCISSIDDLTPEKTELYGATEYVRHLPLGTVLKVRVTRSSGEVTYSIPTIDFLPLMAQ